MKHPHAEQIKLLLNDTSLEIEQVFQTGETTPCDLSCILVDIAGKFNFHIKSKPDEYQVFRDAIKEGKQVEFNIGLARGFESKWVFNPLDNENGWDLGCIPAHYRIYDEYRELREALKDGK